MRLSSFKLRFSDVHVRIVPLTDAAGCPFEGPGVDLRGEDAAQVLAAAGDVAKWFGEREPGVRLRSFSFDLETGRALATIDDTPRPRVIDSRGDTELRRAAETLLPLLCEHAARALARRVQSTS